MQIAGSEGVIHRNVISRSSPFSLFQYAAESLSLTGEDRERIFNRHSNEYSRIFDAYVLKKVGKLIPDSGLAFGFQSVTKSGKVLNIAPIVPEEYAGNRDDFPWFTDDLPSINVSIKNVLYDAVGILLWNIALLIMTYNAILRADVR